MKIDHDPEWRRTTSNCTRLEWTNVRVIKNELYLRNQRCHLIGNKIADILNLRNLAVFDVCRHHPNILDAVVEKILESAAQEERSSFDRHSKKLKKLKIQPSFESCCHKCHIDYSLNARAVADEQAAWTLTNYYNLGGMERNSDSRWLALFVDNLERDGIAELKPHKVGLHMAAFEQSLPRATSSPLHLFQKIRSSEKTILASVSLLYKDSWLGIAKLGRRQSGSWLIQDIDLVNLNK